MTRTRMVQTLAATAVAGVVSMGLVVPALAQEAGSEDTTTDVRATREAEFAAALAEELGLDEETVAAAIDTVREELRATHQAERLAALEERLAEAVAAGTITQEQADALLAAHEAGLWPLGPGRHGRGPGPGGFGFGPGLDFDGPEV